MNGMEKEKGAYLLVVEGESSRVFPLPSGGGVTIGSGSGASLRLKDGEVADIALRLDISGHDIVLNPVAGKDVRVNNHSLRGQLYLACGDTISIGSATLVLNAKTGRAAAQTRLDFRGLRARLVEEVERSTRTGRPVAVMAINLGEVGGAAMAEARDIVNRMLRLVDIVGWTGDCEAIAILPETGETASIPAGRIINALGAAAPGAAAGIALCPHDARDADSLIAGARLAASGAAAGEARRVYDMARVMKVGEHSLIAVDPAMNRVLSLVERLAASDIPVLVTGETGAGKELIAVALHEWSGRRGLPFVAINCAAVAETLFESELFGHVRGAFTDAVKDKAGLFEKADHGTLLLDEIGELPQRLQPKLLRVLETGRVSRVGSSKEKEVSVRVVASTNRDLEDDVQKGAFRRDLFFRLAASRVVVPPLRDRPLDIPVLARAFLEEACAGKGRGPIIIDPEAVRRLCAYDWPGNIRELKNMVELCAVMVDAGKEVLEPRDLPEAIVGSLAPWLAPKARAVDTDKSHNVFGSFEKRQYQSLKDELMQLERLRIEQALEAGGGVQVRAAELLAMPLRTLVSKLKSYGIDSGDYKRGGQGDDKE